MLETSTLISSTGKITRVELGTTANADRNSNLL
jgi:hypothetical protein